MTVVDDDQHHPAVGRVGATEPHRLGAVAIRRSARRCASSASERTVARPPPRSAQLAASSSHARRCAHSAYASEVALLLLLEEEVAVVPLDATSHMKLRVPAVHSSAHGGAHG